MIEDSRVTSGQPLTLLPFCMQVFAHNHRFMEAELQVKKGGDKIKEFPDKRTKSGETLFRHFCSECVRIHAHNESVMTSNRCVLTRSWHTC